MTQTNRIVKLEEDVSIHIFTASAGMVGVPVVRESNEKIYPYILRHVK
jgi:hypothetical protein